jgi:hypothetical protein
MSGLERTPEGIYHIIFTSYLQLPERKIERQKALYCKYPRTDPGNRFRPWKPIYLSFFLPYDRLMESLKEPEQPAAPQVIQAQAAPDQPVSVPRTPISALNTQKFSGIGDADKTRVENQLKRLLKFSVYVFITSLLIAVYFAGTIFAQDFFTGTGAINLISGFLVPVVGVVGVILGLCAIILYLKSHMYGKKVILILLLCSSQLWLAAPLLVVSYSGQGDSTPFGKTKTILPVSSPSLTPYLPPASSGFVLPSSDASVSKPNEITKAVTYTFQDQNQPKETAVHQKYYPYFYLGMAPAQARPDWEITKTVTSCFNVAEYGSGGACHYIMTTPNGVLVATQNVQNEESSVQSFYFTIGTTYFSLHDASASFSNPNNLSKFIDSLKPGNQ